MADSRWCALHTPYASQSLSVVSFRGREELSKVFRFSVRARGPLLDANAIATQYVGRPVHLQLERGASERWIHGVATALRARGERTERPGVHDYELRFAPRFQLLDHTRRSRIFQDRSVPQIVAAVLDASAVAWRANLSKTYAMRTYVVQHQESDRHFVERLLAEEGIFYFFEHPSGEDAAETMVLVDAPAALSPITSPRLRVLQDTGMGPADDRDVHDFGLERRVKSDRWTVRDHDPLRPAFEVRGDASVSRAGVVVAAPEASPEGAPRGGATAETLERYAHHGELEPRGVDDAVAVTRLEQTRRKLWVATGRTCNARIVPGSTVELGDAPVEAGAYAVFAVEHEGHEPVEHGQAPATTPYTNWFEAVPASTPFRPAAPPPRTQQVMETATVVGPADEEIHTDELGRIKVHFHWDREGALDEHASCWIRVVQPWAGPGWGFQFIPRVGMEVMVTFLCGDTDRPVVVGCLPNLEAPPPFKLPEEKTRSGIRTRSSPHGGGYNEISFQDAAGSENLYVHAQRQLTEEIRASRLSSVGGDATLTVTGKHLVAVGGDTNLDTRADLVDGVGGNRATVTTGRTRFATGGNSSTTIQGSAFTEVEGVSNVRIRGDASTRCLASAAFSAGGSVSVDIGANDGAAATVLGHGSVHATAEKELVLRANAGLRLVCGSSVIRLLPDKVEIIADDILLKGTKQTVVRGEQSVVELASEAKVASKATRLFGATASLDLSADAFLKGNQVHLGMREGDPPKVVDDQATEETQDLALCLKDATGAGYANRPCDVTVDGVRYALTTDGSGSATATIPKSAKEAHVSLWVGDPPNGNRREWNLSFGMLEPATSLGGARSRLTALGFEVGVGDALDPTTAKSIMDFQEQQGLPPTGELDAETTSKLTEIHGH